LTIAEVDWDDGGVYSCVARELNGDEGSSTADNSPKMQKIYLDVFSGPSVTEKSNGRAKVTETTEMSCTVRARPRPEIEWLLYGVRVKQDPNKYEITMEEKSDTEVKSYLKILALNHGDNGTYLCHSKNEYSSDTAMVDVVVLDTPQVKIDYVRGVDKDKIFFNWTLTDWNSKVTDYRLSVSNL
jgi:hypothetical protein